MRGAQQLAVLALLAIVVALVWLFPWIDRHRRAGPTSFADGSELLVTSALDAGPGTLRAALFAAARARTDAVIVIRPASLVVRNPLPPVVGVHHVTLRSESGLSRIDGTALGPQALLDVRARTASIERVVLLAADGAAVRVGAGSELTLSEVLIEGAKVGVAAAAGSRVKVVNSEFARNEIGLEHRGGGEVAVLNSTFTDQREAGAWIVGGPIDATVAHVMGAVFVGGRYGIVLGNTAARVENTRISAFAGDGLVALGGALAVRNTRIADGGGAGLRLSGLASASIDGNEIYEVRGTGILVQAAGKALIEANNVYRNGYGIAALLNEPAAVTLNANLVIAQDVDGLLVIGDSPIVTGNRALRNTLAGIRILDAVGPDRLTRAAPLLADNVLEGNGLDAPEFGQYTMVPRSGAAEAQQ